MNNLDKEFIKYFGEEKLKEVEMESKLQDIVNYVCDNWLHLDSIPIIIEEIEEDARFYVNELYIGINSSFINNLNEMVFSLLHELEHYFQWVYANSYDTEKAKRWKQLFNEVSNEEYVINELEIDAYAFAEIVMNCEFGINRKHKDPVVQMLIEKYILTTDFIEV